MKARVLKGIDWFTESMTLLDRLAMGRQPSETMKDIIQKYGVSPELVEKPFRVSEKIYVCGKKKLKKDMETVKQYFTLYNDSSIICKADFAVLLDLLNTKDTIESRKQFCSSLPEERRCQMFYNGIVSGEGLSDGLDLEKRDACRSLFDLLVCLEESDFTTEQKWEIQWVYTHQAQAFSEVEPLLEKAWEATEETRDDWEPYVQEFYGTWQERINNTDFSSYIMEQMGFSLDENENGVVILPHIVGTDRFTLSSDPVPEGGLFRREDVCRIGGLFDKVGLSALGESKTADKKHVCAILKLLGDESKLEILSLLKERSYYGGELAKKLKLTTATISHHMSALTANGLITIKKDRNRLYYGVNEENVKKLLQDTKELLLKE